MCDFGITTWIAQDFLAEVAWRFIWIKRSMDCAGGMGNLFETQEGGNIVGFFGFYGTLLNSIWMCMLKPRSWEDEVNESG